MWSTLAAQERGVAFTGHLLLPRFLPSSSALKEVLRALFTVCITSTNFIPTHNHPKNRHCHQLVMWETSQKKGERRHLGGESARRKVGRPSVWGMRRDPSVQGLPVQFPRGGSERMGQDCVFPWPRPR